MYFSKLFNTVKKEISKVKEIQIKRAARVKGSALSRIGGKTENHAAHVLRSMGNTCLFSLCLQIGRSVGRALPR